MCIWQGLNHDRGTANVCSSTNTVYNYGYRDPAGSFRSILAYNCLSGQCDNNAGGGCTRVQRFSNTANTYNGKAIGTPEANNAQKINDVKDIVAGYYSTVNNPETPSTTTSTSSSMTSARTTTSECGINHFISASCTMSKHFLYLDFPSCIPPLSPS